LSFRFARLAMPAAVIAGMLVFGASAAWANTNVNINGGNVPTTAAGAPTHECSSSQGGGPFADSDVWVFILPDFNTAGNFVSLSAQFDTDHNGTADTTVSLPSSAGGFLNGGPAASKAFLKTTAGWTLITASAVISGTANFFTLSHTCPATGTQTPPPSGTPTPPPTQTPPPTETATPPPGGESSPPGGESSAPGGEGSTPGVPPTTPPGGGGLPVTGVALTGLIVVAVGLIGGGTALVLARRRADRSTTL
jgi:hypothetical protein